MSGLKPWHNEGKMLSMCTCTSIHPNNRCLSPDGGVYPAQQKTSCLFWAMGAGGSTVCVICEFMHLSECESRYWIVTYWAVSRERASHTGEGQEADTSRLLGLINPPQTTLLTITFHHLFSCVFSVIFCARLLNRCRHPLCISLNHVGFITTTTDLQLQRTSYHGSSSTLRQGKD